VLGRLDAGHNKGGGKMSRKIAFCGIFAALAVVLLYIASIVPTGKLALYFMASLPVAFTIVEFGAGAGTAVYVAVSALSVFITGYLYSAVPFLFFFGHYPIFKYYIEKGKGMAAEIMLKLIVFNLSLGLAFIMFRSVFLNPVSTAYINSAAVAAVLAVVAQGLFFVYDYVFSRVIYYYESRVNLFKNR